MSHLTRSAASEFGDKGIRINAVAPGMVLTGEFRPTVQRALTVAMTRDTIHERQGLVDHHTALKRVAAPEEMAASIVYLAVSSLNAAGRTCPTRHAPDCRSIGPPVPNG